MSMNQTEQLAFAYYAATQANDLNIATRFYPYGELVMIITDKIQVAVRQFGTRASMSAKGAATAFVDHMIEKGGWSTTQNKFGGSMHQWQDAAFKAALRDLQASDPLIVAAKDGGDSYWADAFAAAAA